MTRMFVAVDVSEPARREIASLQQELLASGSLHRHDVKPVEKENFHFTLMFLGEKGDEDAIMIRNKLSEIKFSPFTLTYTGIGGFPRPDRARVVWSGVDKSGSEKLGMLAKDVASRMEELGFRSDKPFSPHMTLFRARGGNRGQPQQHVNLGNMVEKYGEKKFASDTVDSLRLKKSDLTPAGPIYSDIFTVEAQK